MPLDNRGALQLGLLIFILPVQYLITTYYGASNSQKEFNLKQIYDKVKHYRVQYFSWNNWETWCLNLLTKAKSFFMINGNFGQEHGESVAIEVLEYRNSKGYFAASTEPRSPRPAAVKYRVGQVVRHKQWNCRGVIIGWDAVPKAPNSWMQNSIPSDKSHWKRSPAYLLLIDSRDRSHPETVYVVQDNLELLERTMIVHKNLDNYFDGFDGHRYLPRQRLKTTYPDD